MSRLRFGIVLSIGTLAACLLGCDKLVYETSGYVSREQFAEEAHWGCPLPSDAHEVRARWVSGGTQENVINIRFSADVTKMEETVEKWASMPRFSHYGSRVQWLNLEQANLRGISRRLEWWRPWDIKHGSYFVIQRNSGNGLRGWIDFEKRTVYIQDEG